MHSLFGNSPLFLPLPPFALSYSNGVFACSAQAGVKSARLNICTQVCEHRAGKDVKEGGRKMRYKGGRGGDRKVVVSRWSVWFIDLSMKSIYVKPLCATDRPWGINVLIWNGAERRMDLHGGTRWWTKKREREEKWKDKDVGSEVEIIDIAV